MILHPNHSWLRKVLALRGSSLSKTWPRIIAITLFATLVSSWAYSTKADWTLSLGAFSSLGLALAVFLGFRNNESYRRFWEGRELWGRLINSSRSFARQMDELLVAPKNSDPAEAAVMRRRLLRATIAYAHALRHHLRESDPSPELDIYLDLVDREHANGKRNVPLAILQRMGTHLREAWQEHYIHDVHLPVLEATLNDITAVQGGCERIRNTPIPYSYSVLLHRTVLLYCLALPFGLYAAAGIYTPVLVMFISYTFFGLDAIGDDVEQPFEMEDNDLPLHGLCRTLEINLLESMGEKNLPDPLRPVDGVLL